MKVFKNVDKKLIKILFCYYTTVAFLSLIKRIFWKLQIATPTNAENQKFINIDWLSLIIYNIFFDWLIVLFLMVGVAHLTKKMINQKVKWKNIIIIHSIIALVFSWLIFLVASILTLFLEGFEKALVNLSLNHYMSVFDINFLIYTSMLGIILIYYYIQYVKQIQQEKAVLSIQLINEKMKFLQSQMHPHFLFNTLNGIHSLMDIDINKSKSMIVDLSDLLRNVLDKKDENLIELQEELTILKKYININKTRFSDQLTFHINIEDNLENVLVPNMLIQPIIENATKHGYSKSHTTIEIYLSIKKKNNLLVITIENNGKLLTENFQTLLKKGSGLNNIKERLKTLYKNEHEFCVYNNSNKVITKISFPIKISVSEISDEFQLVN